MQIEDQLASLHDEFEPAGSIHPESTREFGRVFDPFHEIFDEEEVVIDRFPAHEGDMLRDRPVVFSSEGRELAQMLAPLTTPSAPTIVTSTVTERQETQRTTIEQPTVQASVAKMEPSHDVAALEVEEPLLEVVEAFEWEDVSTPVEYEPAIVQSHPAPVQECSQAQSVENDDDLIVVEDDVHEPPARTPPPVVRRQEYRQLFARLRRG